MHRSKGSEGDECFICRCVGAKGELDEGIKKMETMMGKSKECNNVEKEKLEFGTQSEEGRHLCVIDCLYWMSRRLHSGATSIVAWG